MPIHASKSLFSITFQIRVGKSTGTCFAITKEEVQYLVTAKHLFPKNKADEAIAFEIWKDGAWLAFKSTIKLPTEKGVDIAVIPLASPIAPVHSITTNEGLVIGSETFFFGFPFGIRQDVADLNGGFPFALVKKAIISGTFGQKGIIGIFLDGHNNVGFSGGPIGYFDKEKKKLVILGVISGYVNSKREITTPQGKFPVKENSGLILGYGVIHAMRVIAQQKGA